MCGCGASLCELCDVEGFYWDWGGWEGDFYPYKETLRGSRAEEWWLRVEGVDRCSSL